jgi:hypothetical protein
MEIKNKKQIPMVAAILVGVGLIGASSTMTTFIPKAYAEKSVCYPFCSFGGGANPYPSTGGGSEPNYNDCPSSQAYVKGVC